MKKTLILTAMMAMAIGTNAAKVTPKQAVAPEPQPTWTEWNDQQVNQVNRYRLHTNFFAYESEAVAKAGDMTRSANFLSLHGAWKFK